ncbi:MAG: M28 family peptidase [Chloroflexi bacterium]|nr:M28 family peptidase [Chloroflexota bacterium]
MDAAPTVRAAAHLRRLCVDIASRRVGSAGNQAATAYFAEQVAERGWRVERQTFDCTDWESGEATLQAAGVSFRAYPSPYTLGCDVRAPLAVISKVAALEVAPLADRVVLLRGPIAAEQLMPKNFPFWNPEEHQRIVRALEERHPLAIIAATSRDVQMVGGQYPFPLIEDGDFDIPSVYLTEEEGERLATHAGQVVTLHSVALRIPSTGCNIVARAGAGPQRLVIMAHIDARLGSPGAGDNASGVVALLLLAELLAGYEGALAIELVAVNGEDYYSNPGEQLYLARNEGRWDEVVLGINLDDIGYHRGRVAWSLYDCPATLERAIRAAFDGRSVFVEGEPWYQGDHGLYLLQERPALALTSELVAELMTQITHTPNDRAEWVDAARLVSVAEALAEFLHGLSGAVV